MAKTKMDRVRQLADELATHLGDNLSALILFGSHARPGYAAEHADVNLFLIVKDASTGALRPIQPVVAEWARRREPPPLIVSESEWIESADVFPIEVEDMREAHQLLKGTNPFATIATREIDLRQELEREIRGKLLRLRSEYAASAPDGKALTRLLLDSVGAFFILMRALVRLVGGTPGTDPRHLVQQAAEAADLDPTAFDWVVSKISGSTVQALKPYDSVGARYVDEIEKMARFVDRFVAQPAGTANEDA